MKEYYFINSNNGPFMGKSDFENIDDELGAHLICGRYNIKNKILRKFNKIHTSINLNEKFKIPFKSIWKKWDNFEKLAGKNSVFIFTDSSIRRMEFKDLKKLQEKGSSIYLVFLNTAVRPGAKYGAKMAQKIKFSKIYTIDSSDAKTYKWEYTNQVYFADKINKSVKECKNDEEFDLFFVGMAKDRLNVLHDVWQKFRKFRLKFFITDVDSNAQIKDSNIIYNKRISYKEVIKYIEKSNCILEVVQGVQHGLTYRIYEALCYNKKLLTNNEAVLKLPYYSEKYIQYFKNVEDINIDFVLERTCVDYHYNDEYSPRHLVDRIKHNEGDL